MLKFTSKGSITLDITSRRLSESRSEIAFRIDDTGIGIKEAHREEIFNKFTQADESTTRRFGGTGLGLTICKWLVEEMGGKIGVESVQGQGSSFWFTVPLAIASAEQAQRLQATEEANRNILTAEGATDFSDEHVIVIDDHPVNLFFAKKLLLKFGFKTVDTAEDGKTGLAMIAQKNYDIIITDCQMPEIDGYQVSRTIRATEQSSDRRVPIIAMTANAMVGDREKCMEAGMDDYVSKPINGDRMREVMVKWLKHEATPAHDMNVSAATAAFSPPSAEETSSATPVDMVHLNSFIGDDADERSLVMDLFLRGAEDSIAVMQAQLDKGDAQQWRSAAHKLKGSAANFGANHLRATCLQAEKEYEASHSEKQQMLHLVEQAYEDVRRYLEQV